MTTTIHFNTGRMYSAHGQRISATLDKGVVTFMDHDRMINGEFPLNLHCRLSVTEVMHWYDSGAYRQTRRSFEDGMMRGGVNTLASYDEVTSAAAATKRED